MIFTIRFLQRSFLIHKHGAFACAIPALNMKQIKTKMVNDAQKPKVSTNLLSQLMNDYKSKCMPPCGQGRRILTK